MPSPPFTEFAVDDGGALVLVHAPLIDIARAYRMCEVVAAVRSSSSLREPSGASYEPVESRVLQVQRLVNWLASELRVPLAYEHSPEKECRYRTRFGQCTGVHGDGDGDGDDDVVPAGVFDMDNMHCRATHWASLMRMYDCTPAWLAGEPLPLVCGDARECSETLPAHATVRQPAIEARAVVDETDVMRGVADAATRTYARQLAAIADTRVRALARVRAAEQQRFAQPIIDGLGGIDADALVLPHAELFGDDASGVASLVRAGALTGAALARPDVAAREPHVASLLDRCVDALVRALARERAASEAAAAAVHERRRSEVWHARDEHAARVFDAREPRDAIVWRALHERHERRIAELGAAALPRLSVVLLEREAARGGASAVLGEQQLRHMLAMVAAEVQHEVAIREALLDDAQSAPDGAAAVGSAAALLTLAEREALAREVRDGRAFVQLVSDESALWARLAAGESIRSLVPARAPLAVHTRYWHMLSALGAPVRLQAREERALRAVGAEYRAAWDAWLDAYAARQRAAARSGAAGDAVLVLRAIAVRATGRDQRAWLQSDALHALVLERLYSEHLECCDASPARAGDGDLAHAIAAQNAGVPLQVRVSRVPDALVAAVAALRARVARDAAHGGSDGGRT